MMTKVLVYGYCVGVFSSRRLGQRLQEDVAFRVLAAGNEPDFRTISDFRRIHLEALEGLFQQVLRMALELGAMKLGRVAALFLLVIGFDPAQIHLIHQITDEIRQVLLRQPVTQARG